MKYKINENQASKIGLNLKKVLHELYACFGKFSYTFDKKRPFIENDDFRVIS